MIATDPENKKKKELFERRKARYYPLALIYEKFEVHRTDLVVTTVHDVPRPGFALDVYQYSSCN